MFVCLLFPAAAAPLIPAGKAVCYNHWLTVKKKYLPSRGSAWYCVVDKKCDMSNEGGVCFRGVIAALHSGMQLGNPDNTKDYTTELKEPE